MSECRAPAKNIQRFGPMDIKTRTGALNTKPIPSKKTEAPPRYNLFSRADRRIYTHSEFGLK